MIGVVLYVDPDVSKALAYLQEFGVIPENTDNLQM